jgi:hypothetical protein
MSEKGTFVVDRGFFEHPRFAREPFTEREAWLWLVSEAAFKPHARRIGSTEITLQRGQLAASLRFMAERWQWPEASVRRFLTKLKGLPPKTDALIDAASDAGITVVTICKYDVYQRRLGSSDTPSDAGATQRRRKVEGMEEKEEDVVGAREIDTGMLAHELRMIFGIQEDDVPGWRHDAMAVWLAAGRAAGWQPQIVRIAARRVASQRRGRGLPNSFRYLDKPIASEHDLAARPVPQPRERPPQQSELVLVRGGQRSLPLPADWHPSEIARAYARQQGLDARGVEREAERFRNHARQAGRHSADWEASFRNWCIEAAERLGCAPAPAPAAASATQVRVQSGTPQWEAWQAYLKRTRGRGSPCVDLGWYFPTEWPPDHEVARHG